MKIIIANIYCRIIGVRLERTGFFGNMRPDEETQDTHIRSLYFSYPITVQEDISRPPLSHKSESFSEDQTEKLVMNLTEESLRLLDSSECIVDSLYNDTQVNSSAISQTEEGEQEHKDNERKGNLYPSSYKKEALDRLSKKEFEGIQSTAGRKGWVISTSLLRFGLRDLFRNNPDRILSADIVLLCVFSSMCIHRGDPYESSVDRKCPLQEGTTSEAFVCMDKLTHETCEMHSYNRSMYEVYPHIHTHTHTYTHISHIYMSILIRFVYH
eukprot:GHVR01141057.1.p1 GENE.GHVR01141057.1~~GHVR01141057.1.p1  ORF type:complete len:269 (+),score=64.90 GHVR01141057.1:551-1357(+)